MVTKLIKSWCPLQCMFIRRTGVVGMHGVGGVSCLWWCECAMFGGNVDEDDWFCCSVWNVLHLFNKCTWIWPLEDKQLICVAKGGGCGRAFQSAERCCVLCMSCASGVVFGLWYVLSVIIWNFSTIKIQCTKLPNRGTRLWGRTIHLRNLVPSTRFINLNIALF